MSLATWMAEFYPVPANTPMSVLEAVRHSILKWEGLHPYSLQWHDVKHDYFSGVKEADNPSVPPMDVNSLTCALCVQFRPDDKPCGDCPLKLVRNAQCDQQRPDEATTPWGDRVDDPSIMLMWLKKAEQFVIDEGL